MNLFGTAGIRGPVTEVTPALALAVGRAVGLDAQDADESTVVLGRDGRETGTALLAATEAGATSAGVSVRRAGQLPTPALAYASRGRYGIMLTASHNPPADNGIKVFEDGTEYDRAGERRIEDRVASETSAADWDEWGNTEHIAVLSEYRDAVTGFVSDYGADPDLTVAVDCGNGMASLATPQVLTGLGADVRALHANVDGHFTARESKPTPETLTDLRGFVADTEATLGIGHDGDADRIVIVDSEGDVVHEDTILAIVAEHYTRASNSDDPVVVTTPNASGRIDERVRAAGGRVERIRLGALHEGIAMVRENRDETPGDTEVVFAAEPWKHIHPAFGEWIDGVTSAALLTRLVADSSLAALREPVAERPYRKKSVECPDGQKGEVMGRLETTLPDTFPEAAVETKYGVRLELADGAWTLVRPSGTEPYIRVYAESESVDELVETVVDCVESALSS
jgi:phosphomannomutase